MQQCRLVVRYGSQPGQWKDGGFSDFFFLLLLLFCRPLFLSLPVRWSRWGNWTDGEERMTESIKATLPDAELTLWGIWWWREVGGGERVTEQSISNCVNVCVCACVETGTKVKRTAAQSYLSANMRIWWRNTNTTKVEKECTCSHRNHGNRSWIMRSSLPRKNVQMGTSVMLTEKLSSWKIGVVQFLHTRGRKGVCSRHKHYDPECVVMLFDVHKCVNECVCGQVCIGEVSYLL